MKKKSTYKKDMNSVKTPFVFKEEEKVWEKGGHLIKEPLLEFLERLIKNERDLGMRLKVSVGTDSQKSGQRTYKFATVIMITVTEDLGGGVIKGRGGKIISATYRVPTYGTNKEGVNERMVLEVAKSIEVAYQIAPLLDKYKIGLEIHADINPNPIHESNKALSEAIGYILGMGYDFKIKPDSWAASFSADRYCR